MPLDSISNPTTQVIIDAIDYLENHGWCQGATQRGAEVCIWGALRSAAGRNEGLLVDACRRVSAANGMLDTRLPAWNDVPGRTKEQVIDALQKAL